MANDKIAFWKYLLDNRVMIPILQRDYAQGRPDKGPLRKNFLASLKQAMDDNLLDGRHMILDFIYGSVENETMLPLDGQQRLTTLWLLHWFVHKRLCQPVRCQPEGDVEIQQCQHRGGQAK